MLVTNVATSISRPVTTNESGFYEVGYLQPGTYTVSAAQAGFKAFTATNIELNATSTILVDVRLELGEVSSSITVEGGAPLIATESAVISDVKSQQQYLAMPLNVRGNWDSYVFNYMSLVPGAQAGSGTWLIMFAGSRYSANDYTADGINHPAMSGTLGPAFPSMESIQEVKADYSGNSAEFRAAGHVSMITKSGQNDLHGSLFFYTSQPRFRARSFFAERVGFDLLTDWGGSVSGPILKNRTFFAGTFEGFVQRYPAQLNNNMASVRVRQGDFSKYNAGQPLVINDPFTGARFPNSVIPAGRLNATALKIQERFFPLPNYGDPESVVGNYRDLIKQSRRREHVDIRVDHRLASSNALFARVTFLRMPLKVLESNLPAVGFRNQRRQDRNFVISDTHTFRPNLINEFRFGISRDYNPYGVDINGPELVKELGLTNLTSPLPNVGSTPQISITGFQGISHLATSTPAYVLYQWTDNLSWIRGAHTFKMGTEVRHYYNANYQTSPTTAFGSISFTGQFTGNSYADFLLGIPRTASRANSGFVRNHLTKTNLAFFFQDDYKVTPRFSVNAGLRYELPLPVTEEEHRLQSFDPLSGRLVVPTEASQAQLFRGFVDSRLVPIVTAGQAGWPRRLIHADRTNVGPRIGLAYKLTSDNRTSARAAYGIYYDNYVAQPTGGPYGGTENAPPNTITGGVPLWQLPAMFPSQAAAVGTASVSGQNPRIKMPYLQQWNATVERELWHMGLRVSYMGIKTTNLVYSRELNQVLASTIPFSTSRRPWPQLSSVGYRENGGSAIYHGLVLVAERKLNNGLQYQVSHTWAKNLDDADKGAEGAVGGVENSYDRRAERGNNTYTRRHRFVVSSVYELPFGRVGSNGGRWLRFLADGWALSGFVLLQTGEYFQPSFSGSDPANVGASGGRPDRIGSGVVSNPAIGRWFDVAAFVVPPRNAGRFGNSGVNILRGPGAQLVNLGLFKRVRLREGLRVQVEATATNALNHPNFGNPRASITSSGPGTITGTQSLEGTGARTVRLGARLDF